MNRRVLLALPLAALVACLGNETTSPGNVSPPDFVISDATHSAGNPDFFWLPPMVPDPSGSPLFDAGEFNPNLQPTVTICALDVANTAAEGAVLASTPCKAPPGYSQVFAGSDVKVTGEQYHVNWKVPSSLETYYRIVALVGDIPLGTADVKTANSGDATKFVLRKDGSTLPIKFRIENRALCDPPGPGPTSCASASLSLDIGGTVSTDLPGGSSGGVFFPVPGPSLRQSVRANPARSAVVDSSLVTVTVETCESDLPLDIPVFGSCLRVTTTPELTEPLDNPATVFVCDFGADVSGLSATQRERVTLHRRDDPEVIVALPHAGGCTEPLGATNWSLKGLLANVLHGRWKAAGTQIVGMLTPRPLYAGLLLHQGGGGTTNGFSDFQLALPAKMVKSAGDNQAAELGTTLPVNPTVLITDLGNEPVAGATVHFVAIDGSTGAPSMTTGADGLAHTSWTLGGTFGPQSFKAEGFGIGGADPNNGPRIGVDPFMPFPYTGPPTPESGAESGPVDLLTGSVTFNATGEVGFEFGIPAGWTSLGTTGTSSLTVTNLSPTQGTKFAFLNTPGVATTSFGGTGGSTLESYTFAATAGDVLSLDFGFLTNDGTTSFRDFAYVQLLTSTNTVVATVANANTTGDFDRAVPAFSSSPPSPPDISGGVLLSPPTAFLDGVATGPVGLVTYGPGKFGGGNGGSTGFVHSTFTIPANNTYKLLFVVMDFGNRAFSSGLVIDKIALQRP